MGIELALAAVGTFGSLAAKNQQAKQQKKAAKEAEKKEEVKQAIAEQQARRERAQTVRDARIKRAQIVASGEAGGVSGSSGVQGGVGSVGAQAGSSIGFQNTNLAAQSVTTSANQGIAAAQQAAGEAGAIGNLFGQVGQEAGGFKTIFKSIV